MIRVAIVSKKFDNDHRPKRKRIELPASGGAAEWTGRPDQGMREVASAWWPCGPFD